MDKKEKIRKFIESNLLDFISELEFSDSDNIFELGLVNSLFAMKLLNYVKEEFAIKLDSDDMDITNFNSVNNVIEFIKKKKMRDYQIHNSPPS
jgi:methoxymalonate biosynthesis acyl carrier protein